MKATPKNKPKDKLSKGTPQRAGTSNVSKATAKKAPKSKLLKATPKSKPKAAPKAKVYAKKVKDDVEKKLHSVSKLIRNMYYYFF